MEVSKGRLTEVLGRGRRLGRSVEHQSAGGQLAPGFAALHLEFESLTVADHLLRNAPAGAGAVAEPRVTGLAEQHAAQGARGHSADETLPAAAASLLALIQEAVGLEVSVRKCGTASALLGVVPCVSWRRAQKA